MTPALASRAWLNCIRALVLFASLTTGATAFAQMCTGGNPCGGGDAASQSCSCPSSGAANPIDVVTGDKYQHEIDFALPGELSLQFARHYNSVGVQGGAFGGGWNHSYETALMRTESRGQVSIKIAQGDGRRIEFVPSGLPQAGVQRYVATTPGYGVIEEDAQAIDRLRATRDSAPTDLARMRPWVWKWNNGRALTFDARGVLKRIQDVDSESLALEHDARGRLISLTDARGRRLSLSYWDDAAERLTRFDGATPQASGAKYRVKSVTLPDGSALRYIYNKDGLLSEVRYADGTSKRYEYALAGGGLRLSKVVGRDGRTAGEYRYDADGRAIYSSQGAGGHTVSIEYRPPQDSSQLGESWLTSGDSQRTRYRWRSAPNGESALLEVSGPGCASCAASNVRYDYDEHGSVKRIERLEAGTAESPGAVREVEEIERDTVGRIVARFRTASGKRSLIERYRYAGQDPLDKPARIERPSVLEGDLLTFDISYNDRGQPLRLVAAGFAPVATGAAGAISRTTTYRYYEAADGMPALIGKLKSVDGPLNGNGDLLSYTYDERGQLTQVRHVAGVEKFSYDSAGRLQGNVPLDSVPVTFSYDAAGRIASITRAGLSTQVSYDEVGRVEELRDPIGQLFKLGYDAASRITSITDSGNNRIVFDLDVEGRPVARRLLNPDGSVSQEISATPEDVARATPQRDPWTPEVLSLIRLPTLRPWATTAQALIAPALASDTALIAANGFEAADERGLVSRYQYDDFGRLAYADNPDSGIISFEYDAGDRLIARRFADGRAIRYRFDGMGRPIAIEAGAQRVAVQYGEYNKPTRITYGAGSEEFQYDSAARVRERVQVVDGHRFVTRYRYDALGRLAESSVAGGETLIYKYNASVHAKPGVLASIERRDLFGTTTLVSGLNEAEDRANLQTSKFGNGLEFHRELDRRGHITRYGTAGIAEYDFQTDDAGRITGASGPAQYAFEYDSLGRLTGSTASGTTARYSNDLILDPAGNPLSSRRGGADSIYHVDATSNRLLSRTAADGKEYRYSYDAAGRTLQDGVRRYEYDEFGRLARVFKDRTPVAEYQYNAFGERIRKVVYAGNQRTVTYYFYDGGKLVAEADAAGRIAKQFVYLLERPVALLASGEWYALHTDWRGTPVAATDEDRHVVWRARADESGRAQVEQAQVQINLRGSNQYFDAESGLHYNTHRYFDPDTSRYLTPDPLGQEGGLNLYAFVAGDPVNLVDLDGLQHQPNESVQSWSTEDKVKYAFEKAAQLYPGEVAEALKAMVSPTALATTAGILAAWAASHAFGVGEVADVVMAGLAWFFIGKAVVDILHGLVDAAIAIATAKCVADLDRAGKRLADAARETTIALAASAGSAAVSKVAGIFRSILGKAPAVRNPPPRVVVPVRATLAQLVQRTVNSRLFISLSRIGPRRNDGKLGEAVAKQILEAETGAVFRPIQNASNNGADLVRINPQTHIIEHVEVKSTQGTGNPEWPANLANRFRDWYTEVANLGTLKGQVVDAETRAFAVQIQDLVRQGYTVEHRVANVWIPSAPGTTGSAGFQLKDWP